jgi:Na+/melibiose symporter-like transporter
VAYRVATAMTVLSSAHDGALVAESAATGFPSSPAEAAPRATLGFLSRLGFAMGGTGVAVGAMPIQLLLLYYLTETLHLSPGLAGIVVGLPKIWDMLIDPGLGGMVDRVAQKLGRRMPVALVAALAYVTAIYLVFALPSLGGVVVTAIVVTVLLVIASTAQTAITVSELALADDMTARTVERTTLFAFTGVVAAVVSLPVSAAVPMLVSWGGSGTAGYGFMAGIIAMISITVLAVFLGAIQRYPIRAGSHRGHYVPLLQSIRATSANRAFYCLIGFLVCFGIAGGVLSSFLPFANQHVLGRGPEGLSIVFGIVLVSSILSMPLSALVARRHGNLAALQGGSTIVAVSFLLLFAASFGPIWMTWTVCALYGLAAGGLTVVLQSIIIDLAKTELPGRVVVSLGVYLGILVAGNKFGASVGGLLAGGVLQVIGFVPSAAEQSAGTIALLRAGYALVPFALILAATLFLRRAQAAAQHAPSSEIAAV